MDSMNDKPDAADFKAMTVRVKGLTAVLAELAEATDRLNGLLVFETHPDLTDLDAELDNLYPDARDDR
jgi:hypothetical protein